MNAGKRGTGAAAVALLAAGVLVWPLYAQGPEPEVRQSRQRVLALLGGQGSWIGVSVRDVGDADVTREKLPAPAGVVVESVSAESPAASAGIKDGDVIVEFDGERVRGTRQFARLVQETPSGRKVQASVIRDGQRVPISVEPRASEASAFSYRLPDVAGRVAPPVPPVPPAPPAPRVRPTPPELRQFFEFDDLIGRGSARLGVVVSDLQPQLAEYFGAKGGVLVGSVTPESAAAKAGLKAGDVITTFNGEEVSSPSDLRQRVSKLDDGEALSIGVVREKKPLTLKGKMEAPAARRGATVL